MKRVGGRIYELRRVLIIALIASLVFTTVPFCGGETYAASKPGKTKITSVKTTKNTLTVKFKKVKKAKKYQIAYKQTPNGKWLKANTKKNKYTIKRLIPGTKYSVKVRAYNGKWGKWSKAKTVVTKAETTFVNPNPQPTPQPNPQPTPQPVDESWTKYTEDGSSIEWRVDKDNTLHIRPISGNVGEILTVADEISVGLGSEGSPHDHLNEEWTKYSGIKRVVVDRGTIRLGVKTNALFQNLKDAISIDVSKFDTSSVEDMAWMFRNCKSLKSIDVSNFDTRNATNMNGMFAGCSSLTSLDLSNFDTSNVIDMGAMYEDGYVYGMGMFQGCGSLTSLDLSNFDTSRVVNMSRMFSGCSSLTSLKLGNFDTSKVEDRSHMFQGCIRLKRLMRDTPLRVGVLSNVIGYDEDDEVNLLSDYWYEDAVWNENHELLYGVLALKGPYELLPPNFEINFGVPGVTYNIADSDKAGYVKKLTANYGDGTRVWYVKYERDPDAIFKISDVVGYDEDKTVNLLSDYWYEDDVRDNENNELLYRELHLEGTGESIPFNIKIYFTYPGVTYSITTSDKTGYAKKLTASYGGESRVWYVKYERDFDPFFNIDEVAGYDADETNNLLSYWYEDDVWDNENNELLYRELYLGGVRENIPPNLKIDFSLPGATYNITDSDKADYERKLTASYGGESRIWYVKYQFDFDANFRISDVIGYDADETNNLLSNWDKDDVYDENDELWYEELILEGPGEDLPRNLKIKFAFPGVTYSIADSDKAGYAKKLTASYGGETRVWYVEYKRDLDTIFKINDVIGYDEDETVNLLSDWYPDSELGIDGLFLYGTGDNIPPNLKIKFAFPGVTYSIEDSDKANFEKKLTASYGGETKVWYMKYIRDDD